MIIHKDIVHKDERGIIIDIVENEPFEYVTYLTVKTGTVRGNHYHKETIQYAYVLSGKIKVLTQIEDKEIKEEIAEKGDLIKNSPMEKHTFVGLEDAELMVFTKGPRGGREYETDTFRLKPEERLNK